MTKKLSDGGEWVMDITPRSEEETLLVEQVLAMYREIREVAQNAPDGEVVTQTEMLAVIRGRELTRTCLQSLLQEEIRRNEKKKNVTLAIKERDTGGIATKFSIPLREK